MIREKSESKPVERAAISYRHPHPAIKSFRVQ